MFEVLKKNKTTTQDRKDMLVRMEAIAETAPFVIEDTLLQNWYRRRNFIYFLLSFQKKDLTRDSADQLALIYKKPAFTQDEIAENARQEWETQNHDVSIIRSMCREQIWDSRENYKEVSESRNKKQRMLGNTQIHQNNTEEVFSRWTTIYKITSFI